MKLKQLNTLVLAVTLLLSAPFSMAQTTEEEEGDIFATDYKEERKPEKKVSRKLETKYDEVEVDSDLIEAEQEGYIGTTEMARKEEKRLRDEIKRLQAQAKELQAETEIIKKDAEIAIKSMELQKQRNVEAKKAHMQVRREKEAQLIRTRAIQKQLASLKAVEEDFKVQNKALAEVIKQERDAQLKAAEQVKRTTANIQAEKARLKDQQLKRSVMKQAYQQ